MNTLIFALTRPDRGEWYFGLIILPMEPFSSPDSGWFGIMLPHYLIRKNCDALMWFLYGSYDVIWDFQHKCSVFHHLMHIWVKSIKTYHRNGLSSHTGESSYALMGGVIRDWSSGLLKGTWGLILGDLDSQELNIFWNSGLYHAIHIFMENVVWKCMPNNSVLLSLNLNS